MKTLEQLIQETNQSSSLELEENSNPLYHNHIKAFHYHRRAADLLREYSKPSKDNTFNETNPIKISALLKWHDDYAKMHEIAAADEYRPQRTPTASFATRHRRAVR